MAEITTLFWDIGGVLLTNAWDQVGRRRAVERFGLDPERFENHHKQVVAAFETRQITLQEYLWETVFYDPRPFGPAEFRNFMFSQSRPCPKGMRIAEELSRTRRYVMAALNNESLELNQYRIRQFDLTRSLSVFLSSCYLGARKPDPAIYSRALELMQRSPEECLMIDDRPENLEVPRSLGMRAIHYRTAAQVREELAGCGVECAPAAG